MNNNDIPRFLRNIVAKPKKALLGFLVVFVIIMAGVQFLVPNFGYRIWFNQDSKELALFDQFEAKFGSDETSLVILHSPSGIFDQETAQTIIELTDDLWRTPDVIRVNSLSNYNWTHAIDDEIEVEPLIPDDRELTPELLAQRKDVALGNRNIVNYLVSSDGKTAIFYVRLKPFLKAMPDFDKVVDAINGVLNKYRGKSDHQFYLTGSPPVNYSFKHVTQNDMQKLIPLVLLVCLIFLFANLKRIGGVGLALLTIFFSIGATVGFGGWLKLEINTISGMVPQFMIAISLAVVVHILVTFFQFFNSGMNKNEALLFSLSKNLKPTLLTSLSTSFGFFSFLSTGIPSFHQMGLMAGFGTILSWFVSYFFMAPLIALIPFQAKKNIEEQKVNLEPSQRSLKFTNFIHRHSGKILVTGAVITVISIMLSLKVTINSDPFEYFDHTVPVRVANEFAEKNVGGAMGGEFVVDSGRPEGIKDPQFLRNVETLQSWMETNYPFITKTISIVDVLKETNKSLHGDQQSYHVLPDTREKIAQQLLLYTMSLPQGMDLNDRMTVKNNALRLTAMWDIHDSKRILQVKKEIEDKGKELGLKVTGTGKSILWQTITKPIATSFLTSVSLALLLITILLIFGLKSVKIALVALIPNALPIIFGGAMLYLQGIYLDIGTVIVGGITLGIAVDDTIHFLAAFRKYIGQGDTAKKAIARIFSYTVPALVVTTTVLVASFGTFIFGSFIPNQNFGKMVAIVLTFALLADVFILPALLLKIGEKFFIHESQSEAALNSLEGQKV